MNDQPAADTAAITLRPARTDDAAAVWEWNFAPDVRAQSLDRRPVTFANHNRWWAERLACPERPTWIVEAAGVPVGVVRLDPDDFAGARISIALAPDARGRGVGRRAIALACAAWARPITAEIIAANTTSRAAFEAAGFRLGPIHPAAARAASVVTYHWSP